MRVPLLIAAVFLLAGEFASALTAASQDAPNAMAIIRSHVRDYYRVHGRLRPNLTLADVVEPEILDDIRWDRTNFGFFVKSESVCCIYYYALRPGDFPRNIAWDFDVVNQSVAWTVPAPADLPGFGTWPDNLDLAASREFRRLGWQKRAADYRGELLLLGFPVLMLFGAGFCLLVAHRRRDAVATAVVFGVLGVLAGLLIFPRPWNVEISHIGQVLNLIGLLVMITNLAVALAACHLWINLRFPIKRRRKLGPPELPFSHIARIPGRKA